MCIQGKHTVWTSGVFKGKIGMDKLCAQDERME